MKRSKDGVARISALAAALCLPLSSLAVPAMADENSTFEPTLVNFESGSWNDDVHQHYHASIVTPGAGDSEYAVQVGLSYDSPDDMYPSGGNLPTKMTGVDRGMFNVTVPNVQANTIYRFSVDLKGRNLRWGIFDSEASLFYRGLAEGDSLGEYDGGITTPGNGDQWQTFETTITTGPRTTELNAFCLTAGKDSQGVPGWCDNFSITEVGPAAEPQTAPENLEASAAQEGQFPITIPQVQSFEAENGIWTAAGIERIVVNDVGGISREAHLGGVNLEERGVAPGLKLSYGTEEDMRPNRIYVELADLDIPEKAQKNSEEAYSIEISDKGIHIRAGGNAGVLYALSTLAQALDSTRTKDGTLTLPMGTVNDWTDISIRALQVDSGRRLYSIDWLKDQIKDMAFTHMNTMVLRVKDGQGLRVESEVFPELVDHLPDGGSWTKDEITDLVSFARSFHVSVIPEFDMPAHADVDVNVFADSDGYMLGAEAYNYSRAEIRERLAAAAVEMGETFDSPYVHVGADEFMGMSSHSEPVEWIRSETGDPKAGVLDAYVAFINEVNEAIKESGRTTLMWNDMLNGKNTVVPLNEDIVVVYWAEIYGSLDPEGIAADGRQVIGSSSDLYHDLWPAMSEVDQSSGNSRNGSVINRPLPEYQWSHYDTPFKFSGGWGDPIDLDESYRDQVLGQFFPIWDDAHGWAPEPLLTQTLMPRLRVFAQAVWNSPRGVESFAEFDQHLRFLGHAPFFGEAQRYSIPEVIDSSPEWAITVVSDPAAGSTVIAGEDISYTITASRNVESQVDSLDSIDVSIETDLANLLDDAQVTTDPLAPTSGEATVRNGALHWDISLVDTERLTFVARTDSGMSGDARMSIEVTGQGDGTVLTACEGCQDQPITVEVPPQNPDGSDTDPDGEQSRQQLQSGNASSQSTGLSPSTKTKALSLATTGGHGIGFLVASIASVVLLGSGLVALSRRQHQ